MSGWNYDIIYLLILQITSTVSWVPWTWPCLIALGKLRSSVRRMRDCARTMTVYQKRMKPCSKKWLVWRTSTMKPRKLLMPRCLPRSLPSPMCSRIARNSLSAQDSSPSRDFWPPSSSCKRTTGLTSSVNNFREGPSICLWRTSCCLCCPTYGWGFCSRTLHTGSVYTLAL